MKANRKVMLGAALVVAIVALAGVGYAAAVGYKAETTTGSNDVQNSNYIVIHAASGKEATVYTDDASKTYAFDTVTTYDADTEKQMVQFTDCYDVTTTKTAVELSTELTYNTVVYKAGLVKEFDMAIDFGNAGADVSKATVTISFAGTGSSVTTNGNAIKVFLVKDGTVLDPANLSFDVAKNANTFKVGIYIAEPKLAVEYSNSFTNDKLVSTSLKFTAVTA